MKKIEINPTTEFHILRHFYNVDESYTKNLLGKKYYYFDYVKNSFETSIISQKHIDFAFKTFASKFTFDKTPTDLLKLAENEFQTTNLNWQKENNVSIARFEISQSHNVGSCNLIVKSNLSQSDLERVKTQPRSKLEGEDNILISTLSNFKSPQTNTISVEIVDSPELPFLWISMYPQANLKIDSDRDFWEQIVCLV
jgi:hypothetical protein